MGYAGVAVKQFLKLLRDNIVIARCFPLSRAGVLSRAFLPRLAIAVQKAVFQAAYRAYAQPHVDFTAMSSVCVCALWCECQCECHRWRRLMVEFPHLTRKKGFWGRLASIMLYIHTRTYTPYTLIEASKAGEAGAAASG